MIKIQFDILENRKLGGKKMCLDELRNNIAIKQKKGLPFICASIIIWLLILIVILLDLPQNTENLLVFCCSCPLLPISWAIGKILKVDIFDKSNPLGNVGLLFTCNQFLYLLIVMWVFNAVPDKMVMVYAMVFGALTLILIECIFVAALFAELGSFNNK